MKHFFNKHYEKNKEKWKKPFYKCSLVTITIVAFVGCSSSKDKEQVKAPTAKFTIASNQASINAAVELDGSASESPNGVVREWIWSIKTKPENSQATQPQANEKSNFTADLVGSYDICLQVRDDKATSSLSCQQITATNPDPVAVLPKKMGAVIGKPVQLDATASLPPTNGDKKHLTFKWEILKKPAESQAKLDDPSRKYPRFTVDKEGVYQVQLISEYQGRTSKATTMEVISSKVNAIPQVNIEVTGGDTNSWVLNKKVLLSAAKSTDPDGDELQYRWTLNTPTGSTATLESTNSVETSFTPDYSHNYLVKLQVYDGTTTNTSQVFMKVDQLPDDHVNTKPTAKITPPFLKTFEIELGERLNFTFAYSYDKENNNPYNMKREWKLVKSPQGFDTTKFEVEAGAITFDTAGEYKVGLRINDNADGSGLWSDWTYETFTARTGANRPPRPMAELMTPGDSVLVDQEVQLNGQKSSDPDDNQMTYRWTLIEKPNDSQATLSDADKAIASFTADKAGPYKVSLMVTDEHGVKSGRAAVVTVIAKSKNSKPIMRPYVLPSFDEDQPFVLYPVGELKFSGKDGPSPADSSMNASISLFSEAFDQDNDNISYLWNLSNKPNGATFVYPVTQGSFSSGPANLCNNGKTPKFDDYTPEGMIKGLKTFMLERLKDSTWNCINLDLAPATTGDYSIQLITSDGIEEALPWTYSFSVVERSNYPTLLLEDNLSSPREVFNSDSNLAKYGKSFTQQIFPYKVKMDSYPSIQSTDLKTGEEVLVKQFTLTAFDQNYTITGLDAISQEGKGHKIRFEGLTDSQVIEKGKSVTFKLILTPGNEPTKPPEDTDFIGGNNTATGLEWKFAIKEKPEWTFSFIPFINCYNDCFK